MTGGALTGILTGMSAALAAPARTNSAALPNNRVFIEAAPCRPAGLTSNLRLMRGGHNAETPPQGCRRTRFCPTVTRGQQVDLPGGKLISLGSRNGATTGVNALGRDK